MAHVNEVLQFRVDKNDDLHRLMKHFEKVGSPYPNINALMADMLDDVIDVWLDDHLGGNDSCEEVMH